MKSNRNNAQKSSRRWLRFSLKVLLIVTVPACGYFAWLGARYRQAQRDRTRIEVFGEKPAEMVEQFPVTGAGWRNFHVPVEMRNALKERIDFAHIIGRRHTVDELARHCIHHLRIFDEESKRFGFTAQFYCIWNIDENRKRVSLSYKYGDAATREFQRLLTSGQRPDEQTFLEVRKSHERMDRLHPPSSRVRSPAYRGEAPQPAVNMWNKKVEPTPQPNEPNIKQVHPRPAAPKSPKLKAPAAPPGRPPWNHLAASGHSERAPNNDRDSWDVALLGGGAGGGVPTVPRDRFLEQPWRPDILIRFVRIGPRAVQ